MSNLRFKYLMKVEGGIDKDGKSINQNKFYRMNENADGTFTVTYGREGVDMNKAATAIYSISLWDKKLNEKLGSRKGYTDVTEYRTESITKAAVKTPNGTDIIAHDKHVVDIISALQKYANQRTQTVYKVEAKGVTQKQVDDAQKHINNLAASFQNHFGKREWDVDMFNKELKRLYTVIPRKMGKVEEHLIVAIDSNWTKEQIKDYKEAIQVLLTQEQSNLDSMASQVIQTTAQNTTDDNSATITKQQTLLDVLGLEMSLVTDQKVLDMVKKKSEEHAKKILRVFAVTNKATQKGFDTQLKSATDKRTDMMWHGSRRANWYLILQQGLRIRPSGAVYNGSMWDDGIYYASACDKSMGYTDGGRWDKNNPKGNIPVYIALYDVHLGKQLIKTRHDSSCYTISKECKKEGYDSVWAKAGAGIVRDEFIIYNPTQCTIRYLVEFEPSR